MTISLQEANCKFTKPLYCMLLLLLKSFFHPCDIESSVSY